MQYVHNNEYLVFCSCLVWKQANPLTKSFLWIWCPKSKFGGENIPRIQNLLHLIDPPCLVCYVCIKRLYSIIKSEWWYAACTLYLRCTVVNYKQREVVSYVSLESGKRRGRSAPYQLTELEIHKFLWTRVHFEMYVLAVPQPQMASLKQHTTYLLFLLKQQVWQWTQMQAVPPHQYTLYLHWTK